MLLKIPMRRGDDKRRTTECSPSDQSVPTFRPIHPNTQWLNGLPFDTNKFMLRVSDKPIKDNIAIPIPPVPYAKAEGTHSRFELQDPTGKYLGTSLRQPLASVSLPNSELDPVIIDERKPIYLSISELTTGRVDRGDSDKDEDGENTPEEPVIIVDTDKELGLDTPAVCTPEELATKFMKFFFQNHIRFYKGSKLSSEQLHAAVVNAAPNGVRTDLLDRKTVTVAFRKHFGTVMGRESARIEGKSTKYWADFHVRIHRPDPLERQWYDRPLP